MSSLSPSSRFATLLLLAGVALSAGGCSKASGAGPAVNALPPESLAIEMVTVEERGVDRFLRVTGSVTADEQAEVSAETAGRVTATPVERGTQVNRGDVLVRISPAETSAQLQEAEANAAQIEARLGLTPGQPFDIARVPEVMDAAAALDLAESEFNRFRSLLDERVISQSEFDQRRTQVEAARQRHQVARNAAEQSLRSLDAARARVTLARKSLDDTAVRAPFSGIVAERVVSVGDYVNRGMRVVTVVRIDPVRVQLTVPEQAIASVQVGQPVRLAVDSYPGETFEATVRFVSPALRTDQRALVVEAIAANPDGRLKPGLFVSAAIRQAEGAPALLLPASAVETLAGTSRVYVVTNGTAEERIVTVGEAVGSDVEVTSGLTKGEVIAAEPKGRLVDGAAVRAQ